VSGRATRVLLGAVAGLLVIAVAWDQSGLGLASRAWATVGTVVVAIVVANVLPRTRRLMPTRSVVPLTIGAVALAMYAAVPETDQFRGVAVVVGLAMAIDAVAPKPLGEAGIGLAAALVLWAGVDGASGRQSALVVAMFAWWPVVLPVLTAALRPAAASLAEWVHWAVAAVGTAAALVVARNGGLEPTGGPAVTAVAIAAPVSLAVAIAVVETAARLSATPPRRRQ
jgi:hypothetical protein